MGEAVVSALLFAGFCGAVWALQKASSMADAHMTDEQRKEREREEWRHR